MYNIPRSRGPVRHRRYDSVLTERDKVRGSVVSAAVPVTDAMPYPILYSNIVSSWYRIISYRYRTDSQL